MLIFEVRQSMLMKNHKNMPASFATYPQDATEYSFE